MTNAVTGLVAAIFCEDPDGADTAIGVLLTPIDNNFTVYQAPLGSRFWDSGEAVTIQKQVHGAGGWIDITSSCTISHLDGKITVSAALNNDDLAYASAQQLPILEIADAYKYTLPIAVKEYNASTFASGAWDEFVMGPIDSDASAESFFVDDTYFDLLSSALLFVYYSRRGADGSNFAAKGYLKGLNVDMPRDGLIQQPLKMRHTGPLVYNSEEILFWTSQSTGETFDATITQVPGSTITAQWALIDGATTVVQTGNSCSYEWTAAGPHLVKLLLPMSLLKTIDVADEKVTLGIHNLDGASQLTSLVASTNAGLHTELENVPSNVTNLELSGCVKVTGVITDLPSGLTYFDIANCALVTGALSDVPSGLTGLNLQNCVLVTGSIADLPTTTDLVAVNGCTLITAGSLGGYTSLRYCYLQDIGWDQAEVDTVIASVYAARASYTYATPTLDISGTNAAPSAGEIAHITELENNYGWIITNNT